jgi:hypothetical protein
MPEPEDKLNEAKDQTAEAAEIEVVAHSEDEELHAGCVFNGGEQL